jgi:hypothetical protein
MFDFDSVGIWGTSLAQHLSAVVTRDAGSLIRLRNPQYMEDAVDVLFAELCDRRDFVRAVSEWLKAQTVAAYHGSRLEDPDVEDIRQQGLLTLTAANRKPYLTKKLGSHRRWEEIHSRIDGVLECLGPSNRAGTREGSVHATISRGALLNGFNHYLTHGSEFDQHAASMLVGEDYKEVLAQYGKPRLVTLAVPGSIALEAANPFPALTREIPNLIREITHAWSYWLAYPNFSVAQQEFDCGLRFESDVPPSWIVSIEDIQIP